MSWGRLGLWLVACSCVTKVAGAHAPPLATGIQWFQTGGQDRAIVRTNRGLIIEDRAGGAFRIVCNDAFDTTLAEVPPVVVLPDGRLIIGTYASGLVVSSPDRCNYEPVGGAFDGLYPLDLKANAEGVIYAAALPYDGSSAELLESVDQGRSGKSLTTMPGAPTAIQLAPSDSSQLYVSITTAEGNLSFGKLLKSADAGLSFEERPIELDASELRVFALAVDPNEPQRLFVRTQSRDGMTPERLLRSEDGGESFETVLSAPGPITALVQPDGAVWAGAADGLYRSEDAGHSFERLETSDLTRVTCLAARGNAVYACAYSRGEFGVLVSESGGDAFDWFLRFPQVKARLECAADSDEGASCADSFADWSEEQGEEEEPEAGEAGASAVSPPSHDRATESGCQLVQGERGRASFALPALFLGLAMAQRRRRRRAMPAALNDER